MKKNTVDPARQTSSPLVPVLIGGAVGAVLISLLVFGVDSPDPEWGRYWMIRPLIVTPLAGAIGGAFYFLMDQQASRGMNRTLAMVLSLLVFLVGLWMGTVLGLAGTMWN